MLLHPHGAQPRLRPEGPGEGAASYGELETVEGGVQVRPTSRRPSLRIGDDLSAGAPVVDDDTQQVCLGRSLPASHAGADGRSRAEHGHGGPRSARDGGTDDRGRVYRSTPVASTAGPPGACASSERMSMRQPVSRAASRAFCPSLPIASDSWKSGTTTRAERAARSTISTELTRAGRSASATSSAGASDQST